LPRHRISTSLIPALFLAVTTISGWAQAPTANGSVAKAAVTAQPAVQGKPVDPVVSRNVAVTLRYKLQIPPDYEIHIGPRTPSSTPGFDNLRVAFELPGDSAHSQTLNFLISDDNKTLERVAKWDISGDAADLVPIGNRPIRGNPKAKVVIVNFDDLECPFCAKLYSELFPDTLNHYKGLIKVVYRDLPIPDLHPWAMRAAVNANCLAAQSGTAYWNYVGYLHTHGEEITGPDRDVKKSDALLDTLALEEGHKDKLDTDKLSACIAKQDETQVQHELKLASNLSVDQTPMMFINGEVVAGAVPENILWRVIDRALVSEGVTPPPDPYEHPAKPAAADAGTPQAKH
jgi:protein-disulfide isomerase